MADLIEEIGFELCCFWVISMWVCACVCGGLYELFKVCAFLFLHSETQTIKAFVPTFWVRLPEIFFFGFVHMQQMGMYEYVFPLVNFYLIYDS